MPKKPIQALVGRTIRAILFDLGDTLWSRRSVDVWQQLEAAANQRIAALLREHSAPQLPSHSDDEAQSERLRIAVHEHIHTLKRQHPEIEVNGPLAILQILPQVGIAGADIAFATAIFEAFRIRIPSSRPLFSDTLPTLAALQQRGFLLGVVTNRLYGGAPFQEDLQTLGLLDYFDPRHMAISADLGIRKPNPAIFLHALNALNVAPEHAAMVGDSLHADIQGAQQLGIFAIWKPKPKKLVHAKDHEIKPDLIIEHVRDLLDVFSGVGEE